MDEIKVGNTTLKIQKGDIVEAGTEAIVNAANKDLEPGGGVCGAIYEAAGFDYLEGITRQIGGCPTGSAVITPAGEIPAPTRFIIHAVSPFYHLEIKDADHEERSRQLLASAYRKSLELAEENKLKSLAFPSLGTGTYGYPIKKAGPVAVQTVIDYLRQTEATTLELILFVLFSYPDLEVYRRIFEQQDNLDLQDQSLVSS